MTNNYNKADGLKSHISLANLTLLLVLGVVFLSYLLLSTYSLSQKYRYLSLKRSIDEMHSRIEKKMDEVAYKKDATALSIFAKKEGMTEAKEIDYVFESQSNITVGFQDYNYR